MLETLREDFSRLPELLALGAPEQPPHEQPAPEAPPAPVIAPAPAEVAPPAAEQSPDDQLGLF
jgi:hypothetical protein